MRVPVRKIPPKHRGLTGILPSPTGQAIAFESSLERDFVTLMSFDPYTVLIEEQPVRVDVPGGVGRAAYYVPDFLVTRIRGPDLLVEIKPSEVLKSDREKFESRFAAAGRYAEAIGWAFQIWTEHEIRVPRLENLKFLSRFRLETPNPVLTADLERRLAVCNSAVSVRDLLQQYDDDTQAPDRALRTIWCLLAHGTLQVDLDEPIDMDTPLTLSATARRKWVR